MLSCRRSKRGASFEPIMSELRNAPRRLSAILGVALSTTVVLAAVGCRASGPQWPDDGSVTVALENAPINLDPRVATDQASGRVHELVLNGLVQKDPQGNLLPDLAESWEVLDEGRTYRFHLVDGVAFHDGSALDAEDVAWTFQTIVDGTVPTAKRGAFGMVEEVVAVDDRTVDFRLSRPHGALLADLTAEQGVIRAGTTPEDSNSHLIGTGPFRFVARTPETVTLEANPDARGGSSSDSQGGLPRDPRCHGAFARASQGLRPADRQRSVSRSGRRLSRRPGVSCRRISRARTTPISDSISRIRSSRTGACEGPSPWPSIESSWWRPYAAASAR